MRPGAALWFLPATQQVEPAFGSPLCWQESQLVHELHISANTSTLLPVCLTHKRCVSGIKNLTTSWFHKPSGCKVTDKIPHRTKTQYIKLWLVPFVHWILTSCDRDKESLGIYEYEESGCQWITSVLARCQISSHWTVGSTSFDSGHLSFPSFNLLFFKDTLQPFSLLTLYSRIFPAGFPADPQRRTSSSHTTSVSE